MTNPELKSDSRFSRRGFLSTAGLAVLTACGQKVHAIPAQENTSTATASSFESASPSPTPEKKLITGPESLNLLEDTPYREIADADLRQADEIRKATSTLIDVSKDSFAGLPEQKQYRYVEYQLERILSEYETSYTDGVNKPDSDEMQAVLKSMNFRPCLTPEDIEKLQTGNSSVFSKLLVLMQVREIALGTPTDNNYNSKKNIQDNIARVVGAVNNEYAYDHFIDYNPDTDLSIIDRDMFMKENQTPHMVHLDGLTGLHFTAKNEAAWTNGREPRTKEFTVYFKPMKIGDEDLLFPVFSPNY